MWLAEYAAQQSNGVSRLALSELAEADRRSGAGAEGRQAAESRGKGCRGVSTLMSLMRFGIFDLGCECCTIPSRPKSAIPGGSFASFAIWTIERTVRERPARPFLLAFLKRLRDRRDAIQ